MVSQARSQVVLGDPGAVQSDGTAGAVQGLGLLPDLADQLYHVEPRAVRRQAGRLTGRHEELRKARHREVRQIVSGRRVPEHLRRHGAEQALLELQQREFAQAGAELLGRDALRPAGRVEELEHARHAVACAERPGQPFQA